MTNVILCLLLGILSVAVFIVLRVKAVGMKALIAKTVAALFYIVLALSASAVVGFPSIGKIITVGLIFGLLGDLFLDQKYIHPAHGETYTHMGFTVFGIGHLCFIFGILTNYRYTMTEIGVAVLIAGLISAFVYFTEKPFKLDYGKMRWDVIVYSFILGFGTTLPATLLLLQGGGKPQLLIFLGAMVAFLLSDLVLSQIYFGVEKHKGPYIVINYVLYFAAQYAIAVSILFFR